MSHGTAVISVPRPAPVQSGVTVPPVRTIVAVTRCDRRQIHARFVGSGMGTGSDFGLIVIWNTGARPCRITGPVRFTAILADGKRDVEAEPSPRLRPLDVVLPAKQKSFRDGRDLAHYLAAVLMGPERDDPSRPDGACQDQDKLAPARLVLGVGSMTMVVRNRDIARGPVNQVYGCHGRIWLEQMDRPQ